MDDKTLLALLECDDENTTQWFRDAVAAEWGTLDEIADAAMRVHGELAGFWRCEHCERPVLDPSLAVECGTSDESAAVMLGTSEMSIILCSECYDLAMKARKKIVAVVEDDAECDDVSALTDEEQTLAAYIESGIEANLRCSRGIIASYPRGERRQLHRYQDDIDHAARNSGKSKP